MRSRSAGAGEGAPRLWGRAQLLGDGSGTGKAAIGRDRGRDRDPAGVAGSTPRAGRRPLGGGEGGRQGGQPPRATAGGAGPPRGRRRGSPGLRGRVPASPFSGIRVVGLWRVTAGPGGAGEPGAGFL